jgi:hypothetical protein
MSDSLASDYLNAPNPETEGRLSRTYTFRYGGGGPDIDDYWYDEDVITVYEGDKCPECNIGVMTVSKRNRLYCSNLCWLEEEQENVSR